MSINNIKNFVYYLIWIKNSISLIENTKISRIFWLLKRKNCKLDNIVCSRTSWLDFSQWYVSINVPTECQSSTSQWYPFLLFMQFDKTNFIPFFPFIPIFSCRVFFNKPIMLHSIDILVLKCKCLLITLTEDLDTGI